VEEASVDTPKRVHSCRNTNSNDCNKQQRILGMALISAGHGMVARARNGRPYEQERALACGCIALVGILCMAGSQLSAICTPTNVDGEVEHMFMHDGTKKDVVFVPIPRDGRGLQNSSGH
jgi:hypothetical protein